MDGTFTSTSDVLGASNVEFSDSLNITSTGQYTLGEMITTEGGLKAMSIDLNWQIDDNNADITLNIVYIGKTSLYFGLPRKFPSCEDIEEPFFETYDVAATDESVTSESGLDVSLIGDLDEGFIGHFQEGCYGRPHTLDFDNPYTRIYIDTSSHSLVPLPTESAGLESDVLILDPIGISPTPGKLEPIPNEVDETESPSNDLDLLNSEPSELPTIELDPSLLNPPLRTDGM